LDPQGRIETDLYVYNAGERLLCFTSPERAAPVAEEWAGNVFIRDVAVREASGEFAVFGVHGPNSTEKIASVLNGAGSPEPELTFVRGSMGGEGVTVIAGDGLAGEEGYEVVCAADAAPRVFETLLSFGMNAVPFGYRTWQTLTAEAGTPLFDTELDGRLPNVLGLRNALDFEKGCYVGQEVVSKVENRGRPSQRLVGLRLDGGADDGVDRLPEAGAAVTAGDDHIGEVTRAVESPSLEEPIALALVDFDVGSESLSVESDDAIDAVRTTLPFVDGSAVSERLPSYPEP
jgi:aminomethyltransferase